MYLQPDDLSSSEPTVIKQYLQGGRLAGDDEGFCLAIHISDAIAQYQADGMRPVLHIEWRQKTRLPDVFLIQIAQRLGQAKRKKSHDRDNGWIGVDAQHGIAGANHPRPQ